VRIAARRGTRTTESNMKNGATMIAALAAAAAMPALAQEPVQSMAGAWECRLPEQKDSLTPPILYIGLAHEQSGGARTDIVEVDGFAREVSGMARVAAAAGGWVQLSPEAGQPFFVRTLNNGKGGLPAMSVKRSESGAEYHCLRLPYPKS
jgi:hypothetical protein